MVSLFPFLNPTKGPLLAYGLCLLGCAWILNLWKKNKVNWRVGEYKEKQTFFSLFLYGLEKRRQKPIYIFPKHHFFVEIRLEKECIRFSVALAGYAKSALVKLHQLSYMSL